MNTRPQAAATRLDATFSALADPTRRAILARLASGEASVLELAEPFEMSQPAISKHLKVLERAGLISRGRDAQRRPCRLEAQPLAAQVRRVVEALDLLGQPLAASTRAKLDEALARPEAADRVVYFSRSDWRRQNRAGASAGGVFV